MAGAVTLALCLPYLLDDPILFLKRLSVPQITKPANGSTWLVALKHLGVDDVQLVAQWSTRLIPFVMLILPFFIRADKWVGMALSYTIFILMVKNVHEHYLMWSTVTLLLVYIRHRRILCLGASLMGTLTMILSSDRGQFVSSMTLHEYGVVLGLVCLAAALDLIVAYWGPSLPFRKRALPNDVFDTSRLIEPDASQGTPTRGDMP